MFEFCVFTQRNMTNSPLMRIYMGSSKRYMLLHDANMPWKISVCIRNMGAKFQIIPMSNKSKNSRKSFSSYPFTNFVSLNSGCLSLVRVVPVWNCVTCLLLLGTRPPTTSGVPRISCARGQSQFWRPHPARSWQHRCEEWVGSKGASKAVAYLGFPAPCDKVSLGTPTQSGRGSIDPKNELGVKGRRKLRWGPNKFVSRLVRKFHMTVTSRNWRQDHWILEIINYGRVQNLIVSREAIVTLKFLSRLIAVIHSNCKN